MKSVLLILLFCSVLTGAYTPGDIHYEMKAMKVCAKLLKDFDVGNFTEWHDFDVRFFYDGCGTTSWDSSNFLSTIQEYRKTLTKGTKIKYGLISAQSTGKKFPGLMFQMHFELLGEHHDMYVALQQMKLSTGDRWRWVHGWKLNCVRLAHEEPFPAELLHEKVLG